ncbi:hypothetical protein FOA52_010141 [Chlamydomonas sp. UWO 241]|nr:hypothetical protein FOA52_010141 [Chlamydomonas sp. UWO 241]
MIGCLDAVAGCGYFFTYLYNYFETPAIWAPDQLLGDALVHDAVVALLKVLVMEQHHEELSPYRYSELPREGSGKPVAFTGMLWTGFRPSDDQVDYPFNIPANMYVAAAL